MKRYEMLPRLPHDKSRNISRMATIEEAKQMGREDYKAFIKAFGKEKDETPI